jgi:hypothetical protein
MIGFKKIHASTFLMRLKKTAKNFSVTGLWTEELHRLRVLENRVLSRIFGSKKENKGRM